MNLVSRVYSSDETPASQLRRLSAESIKKSIESDTSDKWALIRTYYEVFEVEPSASSHLIEAVSNINIFLLGETDRERLLADFQNMAAICLILQDKAFADQLSRIGVSLAEFLNGEELVDLIVSFFAIGVKQDDLASTVNTFTKLVFSTISTLEGRGELVHLERFFGYWFEMVPLECQSGIGRVLTHLKLLS